MGENDCKDKLKDNKKNKKKDNENDCNYKYKHNENDCKDKNKDNENDKNRDPYENIEKDKDKGDKEKLIIKESFSVKSPPLKYSWRDLSAQTCDKRTSFCI